MDHTGWCTATIGVGSEESPRLTNHAYHQRNWFKDYILLCQIPSKD